MLYNTYDKYLGLYHIIIIITIIIHKPEGVFSYQTDNGSVCIV